MDSLQFLLIYSLLFILGIVIGSFLGVVISRVPKKKSIIHHRSHCEHCQTQLRWYDLMPLISYMLLRGRCRYCHKQYGSENLVIELVTGGVFVLAGLTLLPSSFPASTSELLFLLVSLLYYFYIIASLIAICFIDIKYGIIPNVILYPATIFSLLYLFMFQDTVVPVHILSGAIACLFFFLLFIMTKGRGMGFGDVKFAFFLGIFLGFPQIIVALYCAFLTGALVALILVLERKKKFRGGTIPFGPFLVLGGLVSFFYGSFILEQVMHRLL